MQGVGTLGSLLLLATDKTGALTRNQMTITNLWWYDYMASGGHRVIVCAKMLLPGAMYPAEHGFSRADANYPSSDYRFVGLVSLEDSPPSRSTACWSC
ncbi:hypothetical protein B0H17DRAFT_1200770 [Mycena rosella]|uniref:Uncharacterized protein n=1 Tax=Mycena rosella TaxID=1033263 RepID=A0AAD7DHI0_MYCRO|nr:hypothetical protein B0H17DRAFT_1200770 [Mycena rosella]